MLEAAKVLLIEDADDLRQTLEYGLQKHGYIVKSLPDGRDAVEIIGEFCPDIVVTDIIMPNKEGIELIHELHNSAPALPIIAISGGGQIPRNDILNYAKAFGVRRSLAKPFQIKELARAVAEVLAEPSTAEPISRG